MAVIVLDQIQSRPGGGFLDTLASVLLFVFFPLTTLASLVMSIRRLIAGRSLQALIELALSIALLAIMLSIRFP